MAEQETPPETRRWNDWLRDEFPAYVKAPFAARHVRLWGWFDRLTPGVRPRPSVELWPRGGAKSSTAGLGCAWVGRQLKRRFGLYVSGTQDQADKHVQSIAALFEHLRIGRAVNEYGNSKGWARQLLRTAHGFNMLSLGLDKGVRGVKLDELRPDFIILDDVDSRHDTPDAVEKKVVTITESILPAGSTDCAVLFIQNLIHANSIASRLANNEAEFLLDRETAQVEPACYGLTYERVAVEDGPVRYRVTGGVPTWEGQNLVTIEHQINTWGLGPFKREAQHEVAKAGRYFTAWDDAVHVIRPRRIPDDWVVWGAFDYGYGHNTAYGIFAYGQGKVILVGEHVRNRWRVPQHCDAMDKLHADLGIPKERLREIVAGHDAFDDSKDSRGASIADQYAQRGYRMNRATTDRINGWSELRERIADPAEGAEPTFYVFDTCVRFIACIKALVKDPKRPEDVLKVDCNEDGIGGDDPGDMGRYGVMAAPVLVSGPLAY